MTAITTVKVSVKRAEEHSYQYTKSHCVIEYLYIYMFHFRLGKNMTVFLDVKKVVYHCIYPDKGVFVQGVCKCILYFFEGLIFRLV